MKKLATIYLLPLLLLTNSTINLLAAVITPFCQKNAILATAKFEAAAGNNYGTFSLTNHSSYPCKIIINNKLQVDYPKAVTNLKMTYPANTKLKNFTLLPKHTVTATVRYPNGPQCNSALDYPDVMFSYNIAPHINLPFMNNGAPNPFTITTCRSAKDITILDFSFFKTVN